MDNRSRIISSIDFLDAGEVGWAIPLSEGKNKAGASPPDKKETADTQPLPPPAPASKKSIDDIILEQLSITEK